MISVVSVSVNRWRKCILSSMLGLVVLLAGCSTGDGDVPRPAESPSSLPTNGGPDSYTFEGTGSGSTDPAELAGSYTVTWEVSSNYIDDDGEGTFSVLLLGDDVPFSLEITADVWRVGDGSESILVEDLYLSGYHLVVSAGDDAKWSVSFERK